MKLCAVMVMRNEVDILESWARYHAQVFDTLIIADHLSIDGSLELARRLGEEGLPIDVVTLDDPAYQQSEVVTHLARRAANDGADWVFPLDADEFLDPRGLSLAEALVEADPGTPLSIPWRTYVPTSDDPQGEPIVPLRITWRLAEEIRPYSKVAIPGPLLWRRETKVAIGSHGLVHIGAVVSTVTSPPGWSIAHFPVRSLEQLARKVFVGWVSLLASANRSRRSAYQWEHWNEVLLDADLESLDLTEVAMSYLVNTEEDIKGVDLVRDPLSQELCNFELQTPRSSGLSPLKALASAAESIALELGRMRGSVPLDAGQSSGLP